MRRREEEENFRDREIAREEIGLTALERNNSRIFKKVLFTGLWVVISS